jgi:hypothetical protein
MAEITRVNGDAQPVFAIDVRNGPVSPSASTAGTPVNLAGPKLDFFQVTANTTVAGEQGVDEYVANIIQAVQQVSTVAIYQVDAAQISFAIYPTGAFANTTVFLDTANITYSGFQLDSCTNVGFKLATS